MSEPIEFQRIWLGRYSEPRQRLEYYLAATEIQIEKHDAENTPASVTLATAKQAMAKHRQEVAWVLALEARRALVPVLQPDERSALVIALRNQVPKVGGWRGETIAALLADDTPPPAFVAEALHHLDEHQSNVHRRRHTRRVEFIALTVVLTMATGLASVLSWLAWDDLWAPLAALSSPPRDLLWLGPLFGMIGACVSAIERVATRPAKQIPAERAALVLSFIRPATGAASGLVVAIATASGALVSTSIAVLVAAFAAGFSERYILRFVDDAAPNRDNESDSDSEPKHAPGDG